MRKRIYSGWVVVLGLFLILTVSSGLGFYNMSVYMNVLSAGSHFSVPEISVAVSLFFIVGGVAGIGVAALLEHYDVRWIMIAGAALAGASLAASGHAKTLWELYALYLLFGIGNSGVSIVTSTTLVTRWFPGGNRGIALSVASTGLSMGGVLLTPLSARLFNDFGVGPVMPLLGAAFFVLIVPIAVGMVKPAPSVDVGAKDAVDLTSGWSYASAIRTRLYILLTLAYVFCMTAQVGGIAHLYNRVEGLFGFEVAATSVQILTLMSILFRIVGGLLVTRVSIRFFALTNLAGQAVGLALVASADSVAWAFAGAGLFGATVGNLLMLHPLWLAEAFGIKAYARIFSLSNAITVVGVASGPVLLGIAYDFQDYRLSYYAAAMLSLAAWIILVLAGSTPGEEPADSSTELQADADR